MRPKSENLNEPGLCIPNSAVRQPLDSAAIGQGSVDVSPLNEGIEGMNPDTPTPRGFATRGDLARAILVRANASRRCAACRSDGRPCGSPAIHGDTFCYHHRAQHAEADAVRALPRVTDAASFHRALQQVLSDTYSGRLRARTAGQLLYGLQIAIQGFR